MSESPGAASATSPLPRTAARPAPDATQGRAHRRALLTLLLCTVLWSTAGVATRQLEHADGFEIAFWRSLFCAIFVLVVMIVQHRGAWRERIFASGSAGLWSGAMWAVMFTCFPVALTLTGTANTLLVSSLSPLFSALLAWVVLGQRVRPLTWAAIGLALVGIWWMVRDGVSTEGAAGMLVALGVPLAVAINLVTLRRMHTQVDLAPAVLLGAGFSCLAMLPLAWPVSVSAHDLAILAFLGVVQLALPCMLMVRAAKHLAPHEMALIGLLEVLLGPIWAWLGAGESIPAATAQGGVVLLAALAANAWWGYARAPAPRTA